MAEAQSVALVKPMVSAGEVRFVDSVIPTASAGEVDSGGSNAVAGRGGRGGGFGGFRGGGGVIPPQDVAQVSTNWPEGNIDTRMSNYMCQAQQKWTFTAVTNAGGYPGAPYFKITIAGTGRALAATADMELTTVPAFTGEPGQLWRIEELSDGTWRVMPKSVPNAKEPLALSAIGGKFAARWLRLIPRATANAGILTRREPRSGINCQNQKSKSLQYFPYENTSLHRSVSGFVPGRRGTGFNGGGSSPRQPAAAVGSAAGVAAAAAERLVAHRSRHRRTPSRPQRVPPCRRTRAASSRAGCFWSRFPRRPVTKTPCRRPSRRSIFRISSR